MTDISGTVNHAPPTDTTVPLTLEDGREVGTATVHPDGTLDANVTDASVTDKIRAGGVGGYSAAPIPEGQCIHGPDECIACRHVVAHRAATTDFTGATITPQQREEYARRWVEDYDREHHHSWPLLLTLRDGTGDGASRRRTDLPTISVPQITNLRSPS